MKLEKILFKYLKRKSKEANKRTKEIFYNLYKNKRNNKIVKRGGFSILPEIKK